MRRPPFITEVAAVSALGHSWPDTWEGLLRGESRVTRSGDIPAFEAVNIPVAAVGKLSRTLCADGSGPATALLLGVLAQFGPLGPSVCVYGGSNHGEAEVVRRLLTGVSVGEAEVLLRDSLPTSITGWSHWTYAACSSGLHALAAAVFDFYDGYTRDGIVAAVDALSLIEIVGFARAGAVTRTRCRPFSSLRDGLLIGEGAAALRLSADPPGALAVRILGCGLSCDAYHPTDPDPQGDGLERAIRGALASARLEAHDVEAVVAHGTGTAKNDAVEAMVFKRLWPGSTPVVTSIKGLLGHTMGASGLFNLLTSAQACLSGVLPALEAPSEHMIPGIDFALDKPRALRRGRPILALASGFGGNNVAVVVGAGAPL